MFFTRREIFSPVLLCITQSGSFLWLAACCLVSRIQCESQSHLLHSDTQRTQVTFLFPLTPTRSCKCCLCHLSHWCQASRINNKTGEWSAFIKIQIVRRVMCSSKLEILGFFTNDSVKFMNPLAISQCCFINSIFFLHSYKHLHQ